MAKIDLCDPKWVDMVFADKNKEYGAYKLRKTVSQRNIKALAILLCAAFLEDIYQMTIRCLISWFNNDSHG